MKIIFVRNGDSNYKTGKLTLRGILQVKNAKRFLEDENFDEIYSSPQVCTLQTAKILNKGKEQPLHILSGLEDRQPLPIEKQEEFGNEYKKFYFNYGYENDNFQTCKDYIHQVFETMKEITKENKKEKTIIIVAHNSTLIGINAFVHDIPSTKEIAWIQTNGGAVIKFLI